MLFCLLKYTSLLTNLPISFCSHLEKTYSYFMFYVKHLFFENIPYAFKLITCNLCQYSILKILAKLYSSHFIPMIYLYHSLYPWLCALESKQHSIFIFLSQAFPTVSDTYYNSKMFVEFNCHNVNQRQCTYVKIYHLYKILLGCESYRKKIQALRYLLMHLVLLTKRRLYRLWIEY